MKRKTVEFLSAIVVIALVVGLCSIKGSNALSGDRFNLSTISQIHEYTVLEGDTIDLICREPYNINTVEIHGELINYVRNGVVTSSLPDNINCHKEYIMCCLNYSQRKTKQH